MYIEELRNISETLRGMFLPIKGDKYDWKDVEIGGRKYFFNLMCNLKYGFTTELMYNNCAQMLQTCYYKDVILFKHCRSSNRKFSESRTVKLFEDIHFYKYLDWKEYDFLEYIKFLKLYALENI